MNSKRQEALINWLNISFQCLKDKEIKKLSDLSDTLLLEKILLEIDEIYFSNLSLSPNEGTVSKKYNLDSIFKIIKRFYKEKLQITAEENFLKFNFKKAIEEKSEEEFQKLIELITGISAQCNRREFYLDIMQIIDESYSSILFEILTDRITNFIEGPEENRILKDLSVSDENEEDFTEERIKLNSKIENLELEKNIMNEKILKLLDNNKNLNIDKQKFEKLYQDLEVKYNILIDSMNDEKIKNPSKNENLDESILFSELKGKYEGLTKNFQKFKEETVKKISDLKQELEDYKEKNGKLKEFKVKFDFLEEKCNKLTLEESNKQMYREKISLLEKKIIDLEEQNKKLKNYDVDKDKLLEKIDLLKLEINNEMNRYTLLERENRKYISMINGINGNSEEISSDFTDRKSSEVIMELKIKLGIYEEEISSLKKEKKELEELIDKLTDDLNISNKKNEKLNKKEEKYYKMKDERLNERLNMNQLTEVNLNLKEELSNIKLNENQKRQEIESNYNSQLSTLTAKHSEEIMIIKESALKLENENRYLKIELKNCEDLIEANKIRMNELSINSSTMVNPAPSFEKLEQIEFRLKELFKTESEENKKIIHEKTEIIEELKIKNKNLENSLKKLANDFEELNNKSYELSVGEIQKRDEIIQFIQEEYEKKQNSLVEEQKIISNLFHRIGYEYACLISEKKNLEKF